MGCRAVASVDKQGEPATEEPQDATRSAGCQLGSLTFSAVSTESQWVRRGASDFEVGRAVVACLVQSILQNDSCVRSHTNCKRVWGRIRPQPVADASPQPDGA